MIAIVQEETALTLKVTCINSSASASNQLTNSLHSLSHQVLVGSCSEILYSGFSGCLLRVMGQWFKDQRPLNVRTDPRYRVSISGELRIMNLSESTTGDCVCVTMGHFPNEPGQLHDSCCGHLICSR